MPTITKRSNKNSKVLAEKESLLFRHFTPKGRMLMKKIAVFFIIALLLAGCSAPGVNDSTMDRNTLRTIVFEYAGVNEADAYDLDEEFEKEGGKTYYELDFEAEGVEYEYVLNAHTGEILRSSPNKKPASATEPQPEPQIITEEEATRIALEHAGLNTGAVKSLSVMLDWGDGEYEVEFFVKGIEYDYEIDAYTGEILSAEKDRD